MTESLRIREAVIADIDVLVAFNAAMAQETETKTLDAATLHAGVMAVFAAPARGLYLVAEIDAQVVGCLMITREWSDWRNGDWWWLQSVYVHPEYRRSGVFSALHAEIERRAQATPGVVGLRLYVERENLRAQGTYAALGLHETHYRMWQRAFIGHS